MGSYSHELQAQTRGIALIDTAYSFGSEVMSSVASMLVPAADVEQSTCGHLIMPTRSILAITCGIGGLQLLWSTIFSHGSSYICSLGISTTQSSLIWAAAPICGSIVQPVVGVISDHSRFTYGRRRPFIVGGMMATVFATAMLAWIEPIISTFCTLFDLSNTRDAQATITQRAAIVSIVVLNISIQPLQLGLRSLVIDVCPREQQCIASAWASRFAGMGNITGYILGSLPLSWISNDREMDRFRYMAYCTIFAVIVTSSITCYFTQEEEPQTSVCERGMKQQPYLIFQQIMEGFSNASKRVRNVYKVQFFSWMGWFGFLFYSSSFVSQLYVDEQERNNVRISSSLKAQGMRVGTAANLLFAIVALVTNIVLPKLSTISISVTSSDNTYQKQRLQPFSQLHMIWGFSQLIYVISVLSALVVSSSRTGTFIIATAGFSWGVTQWAPFAIIGEETAKHQHKDDFPEEEEGSWAVMQGGTVTGMHNAAISVPQIMAALVCSGIFWMAHKVGTDNAVVWVIGWSGVPGAIASWLAITM